MFYPEDFIITKKGSNLGIIWLMGTLGPRDKKLGRNSKAITNVKISRVCDDIAEPPEPMSLRLSSHLLVGVTRVYGRNYGIFAAEVQNFHTLLRRSEASLATGKGPNNGGIDLPGGGISRIDQITFAAFNPDIDAITNFDFEFINWNDPNFGPVANNRKRRASSKLSSLPTQPTQEESEDEDDEDGEDHTGRVNRKRRRTGSQDLHHRGYSHDRDDDSNLDSILKDALDQQEFEPMDLGLDADLFMPPSDDFSAGGNMFDGPGDFGMLDMNFNHDNLNQVSPLKSAIKKRKTADDESSETASDVEENLKVDPKVKKTRKKKVKRVTFDEVRGKLGIKLTTKDIEFNLNQTNFGGYEAEMARQKTAVEAKKRDKELDIKAKAMVDGAGLWITCQLSSPVLKLTSTVLDEDMAALFATMAQPPKFGWEIDAENPSSSKTTPEKSPSLEERPPQNPTDVFGEMHMIDDAPFMEMLPGSEDAFFRRTPSEVPDEVGRRFSQHSQQLPWDGVASSDFGGLDYPDGLRSSITPMSARISLMTPLEKRLANPTCFEANTISIRSGNAKKSISGSVNRPRQRSRSGSLLSHMADDEELMLFKGNDDDDRELPDHNVSASQLYDENDRNPFSPVMLATLETQCRSFFTFVETEMIRKEVDELEFDELVDRGATKRVAAAAFYNCLTLATKAILSVHQPERQVLDYDDEDEPPTEQPITIRIAPRPMAAE
ncbi:Meiotic recombination protein rec8 [Vanrija pseudolonga]|uniref:Meiotic recombination protein rec8 n=1 Tax=Vanrija pseudolonga TaxID=143232 RepID=A0AAF0Y6I3_9TREE|nr:Meiotic recombination protein rec8 [Vanrija pseudolonga]